MYAMGDGLMKQLLILRHAKSSWKEPGMADHARPLNQRGLRDAPRMGQLLQQESLIPDQIFCSTAKRARATADLIAKHSGFLGQIDFSGSLYLAGPEVYVDQLRLVEDSCQRVMVIGHNPGLETLLAYLTGQEKRMPTAALAQVALPLECWREMGMRGDATLTRLWLPKELE